MLASKRPGRSKARGSGGAELYSIWTGDDLDGIKQAEIVAWRIEDMIAGEALPFDSRLGSERDLAARFGTGMGVAREALEILELRGTCAARRGPGGGIFVSRPPQRMAAQLVANYMLRTGIASHHLDEGLATLAAFRVEQSGDNLAADMLTACIGEIEHRLADGSRASAETQQAGSPIRWLDYTALSLSAAQRVGLAIAQAATGTGDNRLGSEEDLCWRYGVSRASMRQAIRLLESAGIVESRPGRGRGLFPCAPSAVPVIRRLGSYFLAYRLPSRDCTALMSALGEFALRKALLDRDPRAADFLDASLRSLSKASVRYRSLAARLMLREAVGRSENPLITFFWHALGGYVFRAFPTEAVSRATEESVVDRVRRVFTAALAGDAVRMIEAYAAIFRQPSDKQWKIEPDLFGLV